MRPLVRVKADRAQSAVRLELTEEFLFGYVRDYLEIHYYKFNEKVQAPCVYRGYGGVS